jgi:Fe2+ or Zn2+ uptake regulation protein
MSSKPEKSDLLDSVEPIHLLRETIRRLDRIENLLLQQNGTLTITANRKPMIVTVVFDCMRIAEDLSTFEIFKEVVKSRPEVTLSQVQNSLFQLSQSGKIRKLKKGVYRRELISAEDHAHVVS